MRARFHAGWDSRDIDRERRVRKIELDRPRNNVSLREMIRIGKIIGDAFIADALEFADCSSIRIAA